MKKILFFAIPILISACRPCKNKSEENIYDLYTIKFDGCEYVRGITNYNVLTHKGNCNNPIHKTK